MRQRARGVAELPGRVVEHHGTGGHAHAVGSFQADGFAQAVILSLVAAGAGDVLGLCDAGCEKQAEDRKNLKCLTKNTKRPLRGTFRICRQTVSACRARGRQAPMRYPMMQKAYHDGSYPQVGRNGLRRANRDRQAASDTHTGTWSEGFSQPRTCLSMPHPANLSVACGDIRIWSMRMPLFFCQAPAW